MINVITIKTATAGGVRELSSPRVGVFASRGYANSRIANSRTGQLADPHFAWLVFVLKSLIDVFLRVYLTYSVSTKKRPPKYNGVGFKILGKLH